MSRYGRQDGDECSCRAQVPALHSRSRCARLENPPRRACKQLANAARCHASCCPPRRPGADALNTRSRYASVRFAHTQRDPPLRGPPAVSHNAALCSLRQPTARPAQTSPQPPGLGGRVGQVGGSSLTRRLALRGPRAKLGNSFISTRLLGGSRSRANQAPWKGCARPLMSWMVQRTEPRAFGATESHI